jgi:hypothetical protein
MTTGNGLPPLPKPPAETRTLDVKLTLPGDLLSDLTEAAKAQGFDVNTAVAMCVQAWRYPPRAPRAPRKARTKGAQR